MSNYEPVISRILGIEAGYSNDPQDPGGETKWGISKRSYPGLVIKDLTREQAIALYKRDFWDRLNLDTLPQGVAYQAMDFAVNSGPSTAIRAMQRAVQVADDGHIGPHTLEAISKATPHDLIMNLLAERLIFMTGCKNWNHDGKGWARRIATDLKYGAQDV